MPALYSHPLYRLFHELSSPLRGGRELPGLSEKSLVHIEFTYAQILLVKGRIERSYRSSSPESKALDTESSEPSSPRSLNPTVEEEIDEADISPILAETRKKPERQPVVEKTKK
ncbi:hypothetical protein RUND412_008918 [Rhizina undulata]